MSFHVCFKHVWFSVYRSLQCMVFNVWFEHVWFSVYRSLPCMVFNVWFKHVWFLVWFNNIWLYDCQHIKNNVIIATLNTDRHTYC